MKTKFSILILTIATFISTQSLAQGFKLGVTFGYGLSAGSERVGYKSDNSSEENIVGSFGEGLQFGLMFNNMFTEHLGVDLGVNYLLGKEFKSIDNYSTFYNGIENVKGSMIRIMPGIKVSAGETKSLAPYCRFGMILGIGSKLKLHEESTSNTTTYISEYEFTGGTSIGWYGAFGLSFKIGEKIRLITELNMINQTWGPDKFENTYNSDGSPLESPVTLSDTNSSTDPNTSLKSYFPFGSIGLNAGILIGL